MKKDTINASLELAHQNIENDNQAKVLVELRRKIAQLANIAAKAYLEGFQDGALDHPLDEEMIDAWEKSKTKQALSSL